MRSSITRRYAGPYEIAITDAVYLPMNLPFICKQNDERLQQERASLTCRATTTQQLLLREQEQQEQ